MIEELKKYIGRYVIVNNDSMYLCDIKDDYIIFMCDEYKIFFLLKSEVKSFSPWVSDFEKNAIDSFIHEDHKKYIDQYNHYENTKNNFK